MSESCNLYLNPKWKASEIRAVVERITGKPTKWESTHEADYVRLVGEDSNSLMDISCFFNYQMPTGTYTLLTRGARGVEVFRQIASVLGGLLEENDYKGTLEFVDGKMSEHDALPYFVRYAIVNDGIEPHDLDGLKDSMTRWYDRVAPQRKPEYLKAEVSK